MASIGGPNHLRRGKIGQVRGRAGQAGIEYLALVGLVGLALTSGIALTSGGIGTSVERALTRGVCLLSGGRCHPLAAASIPADLDPCPVERKARANDLALDIGVVRLAAQLGLTLERISDGRVRVSFADGGRAGLGAAVGAHLDLGPVGARAEAAVDGGVVLNAGRAWLLPDRAAAERFVARFGASQSIGGRLARDVGSLCPVCSALVGSPERPPEPDERWLSGGLQAGSSLGVTAGPASASLEAVLAGALGRRVTGKGTTWFVRFDGRLLGGADALARGVDSQAERHTVAALDFDRRGVPVRMSVTDGWWLSAGRLVRLPARLRKLIGSTAAGSGRVLESETVLDLRDPASLRAAMAVIGMHQVPGRPGALKAIEDFRDVVRQRSIRTVRSWRLQRRGTRVGAGLALGVRLGADARSRTDSQRLESVSTRLPGLGWLPRADCLQA